MGTEAAGSLAARPEARRITLHESKVGRPDAEPGDKRRACGAPTDGAMAIRFVKRAARHLVTNPPAKTSTPQHRNSPQGMSALNAARAARFLKARGGRPHRGRGRRTGS